MRRFVSIWFGHLVPDWKLRKNPELKDEPFVFAAPQRGRKVVCAVSATAYAIGLREGMVLADANAIMPGLKAFDHQPEKPAELLAHIAEWCLRFTPIVAVDLPDGLVLDVSGCTHLWGGEQPYLSDITGKLSALGYHVRAAISDTVGSAWAFARFSKNNIIPTGCHMQELAALPPDALRIEAATIDRMQRLGLSTIGSFIAMPPSALRRRFGKALLERLDQVSGQAMETIAPICPVLPYQERLPSLEPIRTRTGIAIALRQLLEILCLRLSREGKGLRQGLFRCYRIDGEIQQITIGTSNASHDPAHLFGLFELQIGTVRPALGIELFLVEASIVEELPTEQEALWHTTANDDREIAQLLDRIAGKVGMDSIHRYLPAAHHWPERSLKLATSLKERPEVKWQTELPRPLHLLPVPEPIQVTVPIPDYPPMLFIYRDKVHNIARADGPERIEQEWWIENGEHRDYYALECRDGARYWVFRAGHYGAGDPKWFIHGFFA